MTKYILAARNREVLQQFAWSRVLVGFDFDGTLAPLVPNPDRAQLRATTRKWLTRLAAVYPTVVISGRTQTDTARRLDGLGIRKVIGNHGADLRLIPSSMLADVQSWRTTLQEDLAGFAGVEIELKHISIAVHYRRSRRKKEARDAILRRAASLGPVRIIPGNLVINILPEFAPHKGIAIDRERSALGCDTAIYVGDDESDEDVFVLERPGQLLAIRVGASRSSLASFHLETQREIDLFLQTLVEYRLDSKVHLSEVK